MYGELRLKSGFNEVYCDFILYASDWGFDNKILVASLFQRSNVEVKSFTANASSRNVELIQEERSNIRFTISAFNTYLTPINMGYEKFTHAVMLNKDLDSYLITDDNEDSIYKHLYDYLMFKFDLPLMRDWMPYLFKCATSEKAIKEVGKVIKSNGGCETIKIYGQHYSIDSIRAFNCENITINWLDSTIEKGLRNHSICISNNSQFPLVIANMDTYFANYGHTIIKNLEEQIIPLVELKGKVSDIALKNKQLFPQQAAIVNGLVSLLKKSSYAVLNEGMGCGKTLQGAATVEAYFVNKYLENHKKETLEDVYKDLSKINYRVVVMCPGHLVDKWAKECLDEIPGAKVTILNTLEQLVDIKKKGMKRKGKEFFVIGKDFCKLSYSYMPVPTKIATKRIPSIRCICGNDSTPYEYREKIPCDCGDRKKIKSYLGGESVTGLMCPECGEILVTSDNVPLTAEMFANKTSLNNNCIYCSCQLWQPNVSNLNGRLRNKKWYKISHFTNKTKKLRTTSWALNGNESLLYASKGIIKNEVELCRESLCRKVSPAYYMKKQLKGFFDVAIFDEAHTFKGGSTAQGNAMHTLVQVSKKQLALTGTIAGGYAEHLFYLLYRLDSRRMKKFGYGFNDVMKFTEKYGTLETIYDYNSSNECHNSSSRGKKIGSTAAKPGISPLIFKDFLMDKAVFLDLSDMSKYLPTLEEEVVTVPMNPEVLSSYNTVIQALKRQGNFKNPMTSAMLQFSLSYPDKPYDYGSIINPKTGEHVIIPDNHTMIELQPKEEKLIDIVNEELENNRNVFIYCEYTGDGNQNISHRLFDIMERYCGLKGKVAILEASKPKAADREKWIHEMAQKGIKVFITNPRCVETGLDFVFDMNGVLYNYPTLIFFQMGYNLFTLWQASRRHYRLNQIVKCKTVYMAYKGTVQEKVIEVMAEKQVATAAIQGKFSAEGLAAMSNGVDARVKLVQALLDNSYEDSNEDSLKNMFDVLNKSNAVDDVAYDSNEIGNANYYNLIGVAKSEQVTQAEPLIDSEHFDFMSFLFETDDSSSKPIENKVENKVDKKVDKKESDVVIQNDILSSETVFTFLELCELDISTQKKSKSMNGQLSLFNFN